MKARTRAQKRKSGRGRPRIEGLDRTDDGRIRRTSENEAKREMKTKAVVLEMRQRHYGTRKPDDPRWGYVLGRIYLDGNLGETSQDEYGLAEMRLEAGDTYAQEVARYYALTGIQFPSARAQDLFAVRGHDGEVSEGRAEAARNASNRFMLLEGVLLRCPQGRNVASAVKSACIQDIEEARLWPEHMMELLTTGLDALVWHYGLEHEARMG